MGGVNIARGKDGKNGEKKYGWVEEGGKKRDGGGSRT